MVADARVRAGDRYSRCPGIGGSGGLESKHTRRDYHRHQIGRGAAGRGDRRFGASDAVSDDLMLLRLAATSPVDSEGDRYAGRLSDQEIAVRNASACGHIGPSVEYLLKTVAHCED